MYGNGYGYYMMSGLWGWMMMGFCFFVIFIISIFFIFFRHLNQRRQNSNFNANNSTSTNNNALNILNERYAKGEITIEEYRKMKAEISS